MSVERGRLTGGVVPDHTRLEHAVDHTRPEHAVLAIYDPEYKIFDKNLSSQKTAKL